MKLFCYLLALLIVLLSLTPCCAEDDCCNEDRGCTQIPADHHEEESANSCSPFMVCGSCTGCVIIADNAELNSDPEITNNQNTPYIQFYLGNYNLKFWQPPKLS